MKSRWKRLLTLFLSFTLVMASVSMSLVHASDYENNFAKNEIDYLKSKEILKGYPDGTFKPNNNMSRAEFYKVINHVMGFYEKADVEFEDLSSTDWYYDEVLKGVSANYLTTGELLDPNNNITRGEVAKIISIVLDIEEDKEMSREFNDYSTFPKELRGIIGGLAKEKIISGYPDNTFKLNNEITRAEVVMVIHNISGEIINKKGTVSKDVKGNVLVNTKDVNLKDMIIDGNLYLTEGIGQGNINLDNVEIKGKLIILGGGNGKSIMIKDSIINEILIKKQKGLVKVMLEKSSVKQIKSSGNIKLELKERSKVKFVELNERTHLILDKGSEIEELKAISEDVKIESEGTIKNLEPEREPIIIPDPRPRPTPEPDPTPDPDPDPTPEPNLVDKTELQEVIYEAERLNGEDYTEQSWQLFSQILEYVREINFDKEATQEEVDGALLDLREGMENLELKQGNSESQITNIQPSEDLILEAGEELTVSFNALTNGEAYFRILILEEFSVKECVTNNENSHRYEKEMIEIEPGLYSGTWEIPEELSVKNIQIEVNFIKDEIHEIERAKGRLTVVGELEDPEQEAQITGFYHPDFIPTFGRVTVEVQNIVNAAKFNVVYHLSDHPDGSEFINETEKVNLNEMSGRIFYFPEEQYETVTINIYDENEVLLYTFEDVVLELANK